MSNIDNQIKALLLKKKKIDYISYLIDLIKNDTKCIDFKEVQNDVVQNIEPFLNDLSKAIENDASVSKLGNVTLSDEEINVLKLVAQKALTKSDAPVKPTQAAPKITTSQVERELSPSEKMDFALNNRHLADKKVNVISPDSKDIYGKVVGLDAPYVLVKTDTGPTIKVPVNKVVLVQS